MSNRTWLYYRLSRDDDLERNSLENQRNILIDYAQSHNLKIMGESFDDGVSGMHFERKGIEQLNVAVDQGLIDIVLVKDLSRLGRHKIMTAMYIDYITRLNIRVISVSENLDSLNENHDFVIAIKQLLNDQYSKDLSRKICFGYEQKFKKGFVIHPPYGYIKDRNNNTIHLHQSKAVIVKTIFNMFIQGESTTQIAQFLTNSKMATPSKTTKIWSPNTIKNILKNNAYIGVLECGKAREQKNPNFIHTEFYPKIIDDQLFKQAQNIISSNKKSPRSKSVKKKYSGLLYCHDCSELCYSISKKDGTYYVCKSYHKFGNKACTSHLISESDLDKQIRQYLSSLKLEIDTKIIAINDELTFLKRRSSEKYSEEKSLLKRKSYLQKSIERYEEYLPKMSEAHDDIVKAINEEKQELQDIDNTINAQANKISAAEKSVKDLKAFVKKIDNLLLNDIIALEDIFKIINRISLKVDENETTVVYIDLKQS